MTVKKTSAASPTRSRPPAAGNRPPRRLVALLVGLAVLCAAGFGLYRRAEGRRQTAFLYAARGVEHSDAGRVDEALKEFTRAVDLDPKNANAWYLLGREQQQQNPEDGLEALGRAVQLDPAQAHYQRDYGIALLAHDRHDEAVAALKEALRLAPTDAVAYAELGRAYLREIHSAEDFDRAIEVLRTALTLQPGDLQTRFRLARALFQADRIEEAEAEFDRCLAFLEEGGRRYEGIMDGRMVSSATWISLVKGCHHYLALIERRTGRVERSRRRQALHQELDRYIKQTYAYFQRVNANPQDREAQEKLAELFVRFGLPAEGPSGDAAIRRWIRPFRAETKE